MHTFDSIAKDLRDLGVTEGDTLFLRISYRAIGKIEGGPMVFLNALISVIGQKGTLIMAAFPYKYISQLRFFHLRKIYSIKNIPKPVTGVMPLMGMTYKNAKISSKLEFPFIVIGQHAEYLTSNHTHEKVGYWLLREAMERFNCKCLRVGGKPLFGSTHMVLSDVFPKQNAYMTKLRYGLFLRENGITRWYDEPNITFCGQAFSNFTDRITKASVLHEGMVGDSYAIITSMQKSYEEETRIYTEDIHNLLCDDPNCLICRTSYSFSDSNNGKFLFNQIRRLFSKQFKEASTAIRDIILKILFAKKTYQ